MLSRPSTNNTPRVKAAEGLERTPFYTVNLPCVIAVNDNMYRFFIQIVNCKLLVKTVVSIAFAWNDVAKIKSKELQNQTKQKTPPAFHLRIRLLQVTLVLLYFIVVMVSA